MIYETEPEIDGFFPTADSRYITAAAYLKGLHHNDKPNELMPKDAIYLKAARRFYAGLVIEDKLIIDSFGDSHLCENLSLKQRNKRFRELTESFISQIETESNFLSILTVTKAEKGIKQDESD